MTGASTVSVVITAYRSVATIGGCLQALRLQTFRDFETIVVDSSEGDETADLVLRRFPEVRLIRTRRRLLPGAARDLGIELARGSIIVSTDPDCYPEPAWLDRLMSAHRETGLPIAGAIRCHGQRWFDHGVHFQKFGQWLPNASPGSRTVAAGANALYRRAWLATIDDGSFIYDTRLSFELAARGLPTHFEPAAIVSHHHETTLPAFLRERFLRGYQFARFRSIHESWATGRLLLWIWLMLTQVRPTKVVLDQARRARRSGLFSRFLTTLPVVVAGNVASHLGETRAQLDLLADRGRRWRVSFAS